MEYGLTGRSENFISDHLQIFTKWLPGNPKYELSQGPVLEYYTNGAIQDQNYKCEIWVPLKQKDE